MRGSVEVGSLRQEPGVEQEHSDVLKTSDTDARSGDNQRKVHTGVVFFLACLLLTVIAYSPVLFNWFAGDDFVHLTWLKDAIHQPELIWRNFHSSWLDGTTTKFYRPLISVFMVTDYWMWRTNGLGFHITNLLFHLAGSAALYGVVNELIRSERSAQENSPTEPTKSVSEPACVETLRLSLLPALAASLFALYPLHPEAVSWITGRVDTIVTAFALGSIWLYLWWRRSRQPALIVLSLLSFVLALLSKEMAITVPAVLAFYELINAWRARSLRTVIDTTPYWMVFGGYMLVRRIALGTFVGGYDDSLLFIADPHAFIMGWLHALRMTLVPLNKELLGAHSAWTKVWQVLVGCAFVLTVAAPWKNKALRPTLLFLSGWLVLCLLPVYKIFAIADDLQGSRLAYLATVPLCCLLALGVSALKQQQWRVTLAASFAVVSAVILWTNNQPWRQAGIESNAIRSGLEHLYSRLPGDPQVLLLGLPDEIHGAYVCRNAVWGMTKSPQLTRDVVNCLMVNAFEPVQPFGFLKRSLIAHKQDVHVYRWNSQQSQFDSVQLPSTAELTARLPLQAVPCPDSTICKTPRQAFLITCNELSPYNVDFLAVDLDVSQPGNAAAGADLLYAGTGDQFELSRRTHADLKPNQRSQRIIFPLHSLPDWSLSTQPAQLQLLLPPGCRATVRAVELIPPAVLLPRLGFDNDDYLGTKGYLHLGKPLPRQRLYIDGSAIPGAAVTKLEITRANLLFEQQNCSQPSKVAGRTIAGPLRGQITLDVKEFPNPGIYEARAWAQDASGRTVGLSSDHIVISVNR
jgi:hypothetical protein